MPQFLNWFKTKSLMHNDSRPSNPDFFTVGSENAIIALEYWLKEKNYNSYNANIKDKNGNPMIGLSYEHEPGNKLAKWDKRGMIWCADEEYRERVEAIVLKVKNLNS